MKQALLLVSICALAVIGVAVAGRALIATQGIVYTPAGLPTSPTALANAATVMDGAGGILTLPLCAATFTLGVIATSARGRYGWLVAIVIAGLLAMTGLFGMALVLLGGNSPVAFETPLALIPLVTLVFTLWRDPGAVAAGAS